jgi:vacuolar-type H+-ATPase catalytic subunit A/Vma1
MESETTVIKSDFDSVLDDYEEYVDEYIVFYKKAMSGDDAAFTEYMSMLEKAEELQKSLEISRSEMTGKQASRMLKIQQKMLNAMSN